MLGTTSPSKSSTARRRNPTRASCRPRPRRRTGRCPSRVPALPVAEQIERRCSAKAATQRDRHTRRSFNELRRAALDVLGREEVEQLARKCGFTQREPKEIKAFEFAVCSALAAVVEGKRSFAAIWRLMIAAAGVKVARSAVIQRIGAGSAELMEKLVELVAQRVKRPDCPRLLDRLEEFKAVLANDGSVIKLSPLLRHLYPARRTKGAAARVHGTADLVNRQVVRVEVIGDRDSELAVARSLPIEENTLYINDLDYVDYTY